MKPLQVVSIGRRSKSGMLVASLFERPGAGYVLKLERKDGKVFSLWFDKKGDAEQTMADALEEKVDGHWNWR